MSQRWGTRLEDPVRRPYGTGDFDAKFPVFCVWPGLSLCGFTFRLQMALKCSGREVRCSPQHITTLPPAVTLRDSVSHNTYTM